MEIFFSLNDIKGVFPETDQFTGICASCWFSGAILYKILKKYAMTEEQLQEHGYPRPHPEMSGHAVVHNLPEKKNNDRMFHFDGF